MRNLVAIVLLAGTLLAGTGCASASLFGSDNTRDNSSFYPLSLFTADGMPARGAIHYPIKVAVAQIGKDSPTPEFVSELSQYDEMFEQAIPIAGQGDINRGDSFWEEPNDWSDPGNWRSSQEVTQMCATARARGADYVIIYGHTKQENETNSIMAALILLVWIFAPDHHDANAMKTSLDDRVDDPQGFAIVTPQMILCLMNPNEMRTGKDGLADGLYFETISRFFLQVTSKPAKPV
jgi:hypothetical protein